VDADPDVAFEISRRTIVALDPGEERDAWGNLRALLQPEQPRKNASVATAVEDEAGVQLEAAVGLEIENAQRDLVACELDRLHLVVEADVHAVASGGRRERLVEVVPGNLEGLGPLPREGVGEAEALAPLAIQEERRVLGLVPPGDHGIEEARGSEDVVAPGEQRLADLEPGKGACLERDDPVTLPAEERASNTASRPGPDDENVGVHGSSYHAGTSRVSREFVLCDFGGRGRW